MLHSISPTWRNTPTEALQQHTSTCIAIRPLFIDMNIIPNSFTYILFLPAYVTSLSRLFPSFGVLLTVHLSIIILVINQLNAQILILQ